MTSSSSKRPPGISNNQIGLSSLKEVDELNDLVNSSERLESIDIGMIDHFDLTDSEDEVYQAFVYGDEPPEWERGDAKPYYDLFEEMGNVIESETGKNLSETEVQAAVKVAIRNNRYPTNDKKSDLINEIQNAGQMTTYSVYPYKSSVSFYYQGIESLTKRITRLKNRMGKSDGLKVNLGDPYLARLVAILYAYAPYILNLSDSRRRDTPRFKVFDHLVGPEYYVINDGLYNCRFRIKRKYVQFWNPISIAHYFMIKLEHQMKRRRSFHHLGIMLNKNLEITWQDPLADNATWVLNAGYEAVNNLYPRVHCGDLRFLVYKYSTGMYKVVDRELGLDFEISMEALVNPYFDLIGWYRVWSNRYFEQMNEPAFQTEDDFGLTDLFRDGPIIIEAVDIFLGQAFRELGLCAIGRRKQIPQGSYPALERNASVRKDAIRSVPKPIVVIVNINGQPAWALVDTGSLGDFMSGNLAQQLSVKRVELSSPVSVNMAVSGSRTKVNYGTKVRFQYQDIEEERYFDIMNLSNYDLILGTPFMFQHKVHVSINPPSLAIGSPMSVDMKGEHIAQLASWSMEVLENELEKVRNELTNYAHKICKTAAETPLPPFRDINHEIPLIDEDKAYSWRASKCPDSLSRLWNEKKEAYLKTGHWELCPVRNAVPMLLIPKVGKPGEPLKLRTVIDLRERNQNTKKFSSPLPDIETLLRRLAECQVMTGQVT